MHDVRTTLRLRPATALPGGAAAALLAVALAACSAAPRTDVAARAAEALVPEVQMAAVLALVEQHFVRPLDGELRAQLQRERRLSLLDRYSVYLDAAALAEFDADLAATFGGIGMRLDERPVAAGFVVVGPLRGSPALAAGIRAGDVVVAVDGQETAGRSLDHVLAALRGPVGVEVRVDVRRPGTDGLLRFAVRRAVIATSTVRGIEADAHGAWRYRLDDAGAAYLRITGFAKTTAADVDAALAAIAAAGVSGLVLDLRGNWGGLAKAATEVADRFLDSGRIVTYRERAEVESVDAAPGTACALPMVVLVDGDTISAAEILAAALQDRGRAVVVGQRSFGKGTVQRVFRLDAGGAVKFTIARYERPSGAPIERHGHGGDAQHGGVWPDAGLAIDASPEQWRAWRDALAAADVRSGIVLPPQIVASPMADPVLSRALQALRR